MPCQREPAFGEMLALVRSDALLEERLRSIAHQLSDANLQQMPEFHQRVEVLRQLGYIAPDSTVEMKVNESLHFYDILGILYCRGLHLMVIYQPCKNYSWPAPQDASLLLQI